MNLKHELDRLRNDDIDSKFLKELLEKFGEKQRHMLLMKERYKASKDGVDIFRRRFDDPHKVNHKINNDYFSEIVDIKTGYFAGAPFSYQYDKRRAEFDRANDRIDRFVLDNHLDDMDAEATKDAAITGYAARLLYLNPNGDESVMNMDPTECIFFSDTGINSPEFAMRAYNVSTAAGPRIRLDLYDAERVRVWMEQKDRYFIRAEELDFEHPFGVCPLYGIPNNEELQGDADKVVALIDAYDRTISDANSEIESFRLAYMVFKGGEIDDETLSKAKRTGAFTAPDDGDISYLVKTMDDDMVEHHLDRIHENIYRFSKTPDLSDVSFSGNQSGVALKYKIFPLESKCKSFERKFNTAAVHMFRGLCNSWRIRGERFDPLDFYIEYKRNFPLDILAEAEAQQKLKGIISEETRLGIASFVDDPEYEVQRMEREAADGYAAMNLDPPDEDSNVDVGNPVPGATR